ncbi:MAG TPA: peptide-methionine (S)-S-oxide reductase MsrA, partial [Spirochaetota bacterium]
MTRIFKQIIPSGGFSIADDTSADTRQGGFEKATFAGGCFWCMEMPFDSLPGVASVVSGYTGGTTKDPTYEEVSSGESGHYEAVEITFDPARISFEELLTRFWHEIDPTDPEGQFVDRGAQYRTAIFYHSEKQRVIAEISKKNIAVSGKFDVPIETKILQAKEFYPAEEYHQKFCRKNPARYESYRAHSGRDQYIFKIWGAEKSAETPGAKKAAASDDELKRKLSPLQYEVTQQCGTEEPFNNPYWDNHQAGIYVDIVSGEPLFSSVDKFDSGTGWPSFTRPVERGNVVEQYDSTYGLERIEVRSLKGDS